MNQNDIDKAVDNLFKPYLDKPHRHIDKKYLDKIKIVGKYLVMGIVSRDYKNKVTACINALQRCAYLVAAIMEDGSEKR